MRPLFILLPLFGITNASPAANPPTPSSMMYKGDAASAYPNAKDPFLARLRDPDLHQAWWTKVENEVYAYEDELKVKGKGLSWTESEKLWDCVRKNERNKREDMNLGPKGWPPANWDRDWKLACKQWLRS